MNKREELNAKIDKLILLKEKLRKAKIEKKKEEIKQQTKK